MGGGRDAPYAGRAWPPMRDRGEGEAVAAGCGRAGAAGGRLPAVDAACSLLPWPCGAACPDGGERVPPHLGRGGGGRRWPGREPCLPPATNNYPPGAGAPMATVAASIDRMIEERTLLRHPFYEAWSAGELSVQSLAGYSKEYYQLVKAVPRIMAPIVAAAPAGAAAELEANMREERDHIRPWAGFAASLGVGAEELESHRCLEKTARAVDGMVSLASSGYAAGACAMYAFEKELPRISRTKMEGLAEFYGIDADEAVEYFVLHTEADVRHAASWRGIIDGLDEGAAGGEEAGAQAARSAMLDAASESLSAQHLLLDACMEEYCGGVRTAAQ